MIRTDGTPTIASPGARIPAAEIDFRVRVEPGSNIVLLWAISDDAVGWANEYLPEDALRFGSAYVIDGPRLAEPILNGIDSDGLVVGRA